MNNTSGIVFNIVHGSFVDGYGVRTTVFLKGCPLRCLWCCNPEGQKFEPELKYIDPYCNSCGKCSGICPEDAITLNTTGSGPRVLIDRKKCTLCGKCIDICPKAAFGTVGKRMTVDELVKIIVKDEAFYRNSGGGATIGGGEASSQPDFTLALVRELKKNYINVAIDTCGYTTTPTGLKALEEADLLLYDLKCVDPIMHKLKTGVSNEMILENLKHLDSMRQHIIIRIPFIPGFNDSDESVNASIAFLENLKSVERVDIIGYHDYSRARYAELGMDYPLADIRMDALPHKRLEEVRQRFEDHGLRTQLGG